MDLPLHSVIQIKLWLQRYMHLSPLSLLFTNIRATNILIYGQVCPARETNVLNVFNVVILLYDRILCCKTNLCSFVLL